MTGNTVFIRTLIAVTCVVTAGVSLSATRAVFAQTAATLSVRDAWLRQPMGGRTEAGVFAVVENRSTTARAIVRAAADIADKAELHEMKMTDGMMRMSPVTRIEVPARGSVELQPGGYHVMLFGLKKIPMVGGTFSLTLTFDDGSTASATAAVRQDEGMKMNDAAPKH